MGTNMLQQQGIEYALSPGVLRQENQRFRNTGGISQNNREEGFRSAFCDRDTGYVYLSRFGDGRPATVHVLDGLPDEIVVDRDPGGRVTAVKPTVIAGFLRAGRFYTREQAAQSMASC